MTIVNNTLIQDVDLASLEFELAKTPVRQAPKQYVDNKALLEEFKKYYVKKQEWIAAGAIGHKPPLGNKIGLAIMEIAKRRCYSRNFIGYTDAWKEEMVSDAIEICVMYGHNFNPEKYNNPFAYLTQLVTNAIINRIKKEHKQTYIKMKAFDMCGGFSAVADENASDDNIEGLNEITDMYSDHLKYIADYEAKMRPDKEIEEESPLQINEGILQFAS